MAPVEDEDLTPETAASALDRARASLARGEGRLPRRGPARVRPVSEEKAPRLSIRWSEEARADLRRIDRKRPPSTFSTAPTDTLPRNGDVKKLKSLPRPASASAAATTGFSSSTGTRPPSRSSASAPSPRSLPLNGAPIRPRTMAGPDSNSGPDTPCGCVRFWFEDGPGTDPLSTSGFP